MRLKKLREGVDSMALVIPEITDTEVIKACRMLGLPETAFSGDDGQDPRLTILKSLATCDIEACPGSGKTTLLVAKLAILAGLWTTPRSGLCVLSHTNVARREIEQRLGNTPEGQRLLCYPHFIGTIHGFVNEFLALPWLRSIGYPVEMIDDDVALQRRWKKLSYATRQNMERNRHSQEVLKIQDPAFGLGEVRWGKGVLRQTTQTYQELVGACRESVEEGYFCHDEMFIWAQDIMDKLPEVTTLLRGRFPLVFIDEIQDNSELQSRLLHRLFVEGEGSVICQRYGDANQAIYQSAGKDKGATTYSFPIADIRADIPNSFRFGEEIAQLVDPFALKPQGLKGHRRFDIKSESDTNKKHAIFLFNNETAGFVLETYARYLIEVFSDHERKNGIFTAVGAVHKPNGDDNIPRHVGHYWPAYDHSISRSDPQPNTFIQYLSAGQRLSERTGETHILIEKIAEALLRLVRLMDPEFSFGSRKRKHRHIVELLEENPDAKAVYIELVRALAIDRCSLTEKSWDTYWHPVIISIVEGITGFAADGQVVQDFLKWGVTPEPVDGEDITSLSDNVFRYPIHDPAVAVRVGSIHAAKGETHTATLVLDTFYRSHHLKTLKPWLLGDRSGGGQTSVSLQSRLKLHYVAMTRPARLLCLAMREDAFNQAEIEKLQEQGWRVAKLGVAGPEWLAKPEEPGA